MRLARALAVVGCLGSSACGSGGSSQATTGSGDAGNSGDAALAEAGVDGASDVEGSTTVVSDDAAVTIPMDATLLGEAGLPRTFTVVNDCQKTVWAAALPATTFPGGLVEVPPGGSFQVGVENGWSGRIWGKTLCTTSGGTTTCASSAFPASLAELTLTSTATGLDFYDVSLVDGYNLPIAIQAVGHTPDPAHPYDCGSPTCSANLDATCAPQFQDSAGGEVIACANDACKVIGNNDASAPSCIYPNQYTEFFKTACPTAYSYPSDDPTSTFTCKGYNDYAVVFCP